MYKNICFRAVAKIFFFRVRVEEGNMCPNCPKFTAIHAGARDLVVEGQIAEAVERDNLLWGRATAGTEGDGDRLDALMGKARL